MRLSSLSCGALVALIVCLPGIAWAVPSAWADEVVPINVLADAEDDACPPAPEVQDCSLRSAVKKFNEGAYGGRVTFKIEIPEAPIDIDNPADHALATEILRARQAVNV